MEFSENSPRNYNVIIIGETSVGKTSFTIQYTEGRFEENYLLTVGKIINLKFSIFLRN